MKEELYIYTPDGKREKLDLPSPSGITLKWENNLFSDISKLTCSHSYTFKLPMTQRNIQLLDMANDIRHHSKMIRIRVDADFYINGVCLCPNANLYVSEVGDSTFSCVMTWRVLKAFETLKGSSKKLNELPSQGTFIWRDDEGDFHYGKPTGEWGNDEIILYPDYDAGVPHEVGTPPKPVVPVYRLIQLINEEFGVNFNIGRAISRGMGTLPKVNFNNKNYYGRSVYDDFVTYGVVPLTGSKPFLSDKYVVKDIDLIAWGTMDDGSVRQEGSYRRFTKDGDEKSYWREYGNWFVFDVTKHHHWSQFASIEGKNKRGDVVQPRWNEFVGTQRINMASKESSVSELLVERLNMWKSSSVNGVWSGRYYGYEVYYAQRTIEHYFVWAQTPQSTDLVTLYLEASCEIKGTASIAVSKAAVQAGRVTAPDYWWLYIVEAKKNDKNEVTLDTLSDNGEEWIGLRSVRREETSEAYVYYFDFGVEYEARRLNLDAVEDDSLGYLFWSGFEYTPETDTTENVQTIIEKADDEVSNLYKGDGLLFGYNYADVLPLSVRNSSGKVLGQRVADTADTFNPEDVRFLALNIASITPSQETVTKIPVEMGLINNLPDISCFDFMKDVFYMNGALPRVEKDGKTIVAMFYNQLRDRVISGECVDWSKKLIEGKSQSSMSKYENTNFAQKNYFEMAYSRRTKTEEDKRDELELYGDGYGTIGIADSLLADEKSLFQSKFFPGLRQDIAYPEVMTGRTIKAWDGEKHIVTTTNPLYGYLNFRALDSEFEETEDASKRPMIKDQGLLFKHIRMDAFEPFNNTENLFGYLGKILENYTCVKEQMLLTEFDLRDFDESMPVYLNKYNSFFAVSSIQRDKDGLCTVELIQLPYVKPTYDPAVDVDIDTISYEYKVLWSGAYSGSDKVYLQLTMGATGRSGFNYGIFVSDDVYAQGGVRHGGKGLNIPTDGNNINNAFYFQKWAYPECSWSSNPGGQWDEQPYTLKITVPTQVKYILKKLVGFDTEFEREMTANVKVYYDTNQLTPGEHTYTYTKEQNGQYHVIRIAVDILDENGNVVHELRKKFYYFVLTPDFSVINDDWGDVVDYVTKVEKVEVTGARSINSNGAKAYTLSYSPADADVVAQSVEVTTASEILTVSDVSTAGFTLTPTSLPADGETATVNVKVTLTDGSTLETSFQVTVRGRALVINGAKGYEAPNGTGSTPYNLYITPNYPRFTVKSITSSNPAVVVKDQSGSQFSLAVENIESEQVTMLTVVVDCEGEEMSASLEVTFVPKSTWSVETLDNAGVLIVDVNGSFYTKAEWAAAGILNEDADGIAVSDGTHRFIIAKKETSVKIGGYKDNSRFDPNTKQIITDVTGTLVTGVVAASSEAEAVNDFNGKANTNAIIAQISDTTVGSLTTGQFPSGISGYLGAAGQWNIVREKLNLINDLLTAIGGDAILQRSNTEMLTSTQRDEYRNWTFVKNAVHELGIYRHNKGDAVPTHAFADVREVSPVKFGTLVVSGDDGVTGQVGTNQSVDYTLSATPAGAVISDVSVVPGSSIVTISNITNTGFRATVAIRNNDKVKLTISARVNGLKKIVEKELYVVSEGEAIIDFEKLDAAKGLIADTQLNFYTKDEWVASGKSNDQAEGVAFSDGTHRFIIAKTQFRGYQAKHFGGMGVTITGLEYGENDDGYTNTQTLIAEITGSDGVFIDEPYSAAAFAAQADVFPSGKHGYLPSTGECKAISSEAIIKILEPLMSAIGGNQIVPSGLTTCWCSNIYYDANYKHNFAYEWCRMSSHGWLSHTQRSDKNTIFIIRKIEK